MMARPRNAANDDAILAAAATTLLDGGYDALVIDDLARGVGVAKTTVYRRWPTKNHLVAAVLAERAPVDDGAAPVDAGSDLERLVEELAVFLGPASHRRMLAELLAACIREPALRETAEGVWRPWRAAASRAVEHGIDSGELRGDTHAGRTVDQLAGAVYQRMLVTGEPVDRTYTSALVGDVLDGLRPR
jgi:AcrR family transcriptional regulator